MLGLSIKCSWKITFTFEIRGLFSCNDAVVPDDLFIIFVMADDNCDPLAVYFSVLLLARKVHQWSFSLRKQTVKVI